MFASTRQSTTTSTLPESVAWLENLTLDMITSTNTRHGLGKRNVLYEMQMTYQPSKDEEPTAWTLSRTFDEYRELRRRRCDWVTDATPSAKWLGNVMMHHFPRASLFGRSCPSGVEGTRVALLRMLHTVKASLVNHGNLGCSRMRDDVSKEFMVFVSSSSLNSKDLSRVSSSTATSSASLVSVPLSSSVSFSPFNFRRSSSSTTLTSDDESQEVVLEFDDFSCGNVHVSRCECGACRSSLSH